MSEQNIQLLEKNTIPAFGYSLLREILLPTILGKETPDILYWAGKEIACKYDIQTIDELCHFFQQAGWGTLSVTKEAKTEMRFELIDIVRENELQDEDFQLEAGFLAYQISMLKSASAEAFVQVKKRARKVLFTVKWTTKA